MTYCTAQFARPSGLGNRLFPWARSRIYSQLHDLPMLAPRWAHIRTASFRRGGINYGHFLRKVLLFGNFKTRPQEISGLARLQTLLTSSRLPEPDTYQTRPPGRSGKQLLVFEGDKSHFADLHGHRQFVHDSLKEITRDCWLKVSDSYPEIPIGINVRRGKDFVDATQPSDFFVRGALRTPLVWFAEVLQLIRAEAGRPVKAFVISDGTKSDLEPLIATGNVELVNSGSAISDLLILSKSRVLIGSGGSSFSAWGAFLSGAPTVTHPGQSLDWFKVGEPGGQYVGTFDPKGDVSPDFVKQLKRALGI